MTKGTHAPHHPLLYNFSEKQEKAIIWLLAATQLISSLEFMIVMPLGPDFASELGITLNHIGLVAACYTGAAAVSGFLCSTFIERLDRRQALAFSMAGLILSTLACALATGFYSMVMARIAAGLFGGPAMALTMAIIADVVPISRRGRAMGLVMSSFAVSSIAGIPLSLELSRLGGWRHPFFAVAGLGVLVASFTMFKLPSMREHLSLQKNFQHSKHSPEVRENFLRPTVCYGLLMSFLTMASMFVIIPNISSYLQANLDYPRESIGMLYFQGGITSLILMRLVGKMTDKRGPVPIAWAGTVLFTSVIAIWFFTTPSHFVIGLLFMGMMGSSSFRNIPSQTLASRIPRPFERARFMSIQSSVQHVATTCGAALSSFVLGVAADGSLTGMQILAWVAIVGSFMVPFLLSKIQKNVSREQHLDQRDLDSAATVSVEVEKVA